MDRAVRVAKLREAVRIGLKGQGLTVGALAEKPEVQALKYNVGQLRQRLVRMETHGLVRQKKVGGSVLWSLKEESEAKALANGEGRVTVGYTVKIGARTFTLSREEAHQLWDSFNPIFSGG